MQGEVTFDGGNSRYSSTAEEARQDIMISFNWTITVGGIAQSETEGGMPGYNLFLTIVTLSFVIALIIKKKDMKYPT